MTIVYKLEADGGFVCGDTETRLTAYAYPTSQNATDAAKSDVWAGTVARVMMEREDAGVHKFLGDGYDDRNWTKLAPIEPNPVEG